MGQQPPSGVPVNAYSVGLSLCGRDFFEPNIKPFAECVIPFVCFVHVATSFIKIPHIGCLNSNKGEDEKQKKTGSTSGFLTANLLTMKVVLHIIIVEILHLRLEGVSQPISETFNT